MRIDRVALGVRPGHPPSAAPPVEILLLSEDIHQRAERIFVWSLDVVRDPARVYHIHFARSPDGLIDETRCAAMQRAIVNEVGQIYFADPALLFDLELEGAVVGAHSAEVSSSPLLLDVAAIARDSEGQMATRNPLSWIARARTRDVSKKLLGDDWRPRNESDTDPRSGKLFHFKAPHLLPWRPHLDRCIYHKNPRHVLFFDLEEAADQAGFEIFSVDAPSEAFKELVHSVAGDDRAPSVSLRADDLQELVTGTGAECVIDCRAARSNGRFEAADGLVCHDSLDDLPLHDLGWILDGLFRAARCFLHLRVASDLQSSRPPDFWREHVERAAQRHRHVHWFLRISETGEGGAVEKQRGIHGGAWLDDAPPRVWVLADDRPGNATQSIGLASALGWTTEIKQLHYRPIAVLHNRILKESKAGLSSSRSTPLVAPWPDLVIASGRRTAPVAQWVRKQSGGRARVVALGRKAGDDASLFDLSVTPEYTRCLPHPRRMEIRAPLHRMTSEVLREAAKEWKGRLGSRDGSPRIAVLVGGTSGQYWFRARSARKLGEQVSLLANSLGASLWVSTSRRTGKAATASLKSALGPVDQFHSWSPDGGENPYRGYLACADVFVITADSESMLSEACSTGKPVYVYPMDWRVSFRALRFFRDLVVRGSGMLDTRCPGRTRPRWLSHFCSGLLARGVVRPTRDLDLMHESLIERGVARKFGAPLEANTQTALFELDDVAERVRRLMGMQSAGAEPDADPQEVPRPERG